MADDLIRQKALNRFRRLYPAYNDYDDEVLLKALHEKFYGNYDYNEFENAFSIKYAGKLEKTREARPTQPVGPPITEARQVLPEIPEESKTPGWNDVDAITQAYSRAPKSGIIAKTVEEARRGLESFHLDQEAYEAAVGLKDWKEVENKYIRQQRLERFEPIHQGPQSLLEKGYYGAARMAPPMLETTLKGMITGGVAAGMAGLASMAGPQAAAAPITVPAAFATGTKLGAMWEWYRQGTGQFYAAMRLQGISHPTASITSQIAGLPYAMVEFSQASKIIPGLDRAAFRIIGGSIKEIAKKMAKIYGSQWAEEVTEEELQEIIGIGTEEISKRIDDLMGKSSIEGTTIKAILTRLWQVGVDSALSMGILLLPGKAGQTGRSMVEAKIQENKIEDEINQALEFAAQAQALQATIPHARREIPGEKLEDFITRRMHERISKRKPGEYASKREERNYLKTILNEMKKEQAERPGIKPEIVPPGTPVERPQKPVVPEEGEDLESIPDHVIIPYLVDYYGLSDEQILMTDRKTRLWLYTAGRAGEMTEEMQNKLFGGKENAERIRENEGQIPSPGPELRPGTGEGGENLELPAPPESGREGTFREEGIEPESQPGEIEPGEESLPPEEAETIEEGKIEEPEKEPPSKPPEPKAIKEELPTGILTPPRKEKPSIKGKRGLFPEGSVKVELNGAYSDGHWALKEEYIDQELKNKLNEVEPQDRMEKTVDDYWSEQIKSAIPANYAGIANQKIRKGIKERRYKDLPDLAIFTAIDDKGQRYASAFNLNYINYFIKNIPNFRFALATVNAFRFSDEAYPSYMGIIYSGDKVAGVVMPISISREYKNRAAEKFMNEFLGEEKIEEEPAEEPPKKPPETPQERRFPEKPIPTPTKEEISKPTPVSAPGKRIVKYIGLGDRPDGMYMAYANLPNGSTIIYNPETDQLSPEDQAKLEKDMAERGITELALYEKEPEVEEVEEEKEEPAETGEKKIGIQVRINEEKNGIEIIFDKKPDRVTIDRLKKHGFRFSAKQRLWWAKRTRMRMDFANDLKESREETGIKPEEKKTPEAGNEQGVLIKNILEKLKSGEGIKDNTELMKMAEEAYGKTRASGAFNSQNVYNALETAVNMFIMSSNIGEIEAKGYKALTGHYAVLEWIKDKILNKIPTQTHRTPGKDLLQQFSTPPSLAYLVVKAADINKDDVVLEPSAGTGNLVAFAIQKNPKEIDLNEIDNERTALLRQTFGDKENVKHITQKNAEFLNDVLNPEIKPTVIIMNPPFSATGGRVSQNKNIFGLRHIEQALMRLQDGGRLVAILGEGFYIASPTMKSWYDNIKSKYTIRGVWKIPGNQYQKYGTSFGNTLLIIDKTGPTTKETYYRFGELKSLGDLANEIDKITKEKRPALENAGRNVGLGRGPESGEMEVSGRNIPIGHRGSGVAVGAGKSSNRPAEVPQTEPATKPGKIKSTEQERPGEGFRGDIETLRKREGLEKATDIQIIDELIGRKEETGGKFVEYVPQKLGIGVKHPVKIVEAVSMGAVEPPEITYESYLPDIIISDGLISNIQLEAVLYAGQSHQLLTPDGKRIGFYLGDGTGVGKGRTIASIIYDNFLQGRKRALWVSFGADLYDAAIEDMKDIGMAYSEEEKHKKLAGLPKVKHRLINEYTPDEEIDLEEGVIFTTYSSLISKSSKTGKTRLQQLIDWLGEDCVIIFDEAHKAKNALAGDIGKPTATGQTVIDLQDKLPKARIVYSSATGATDVKNMAYMTRLHLWGEGTSFYTFNDFMYKIEAGGIGAMEIVARDMKAQGKYLSRSISFEGVDYDEVIHPLTNEQKKIYNTAAKAWQVVLNDIEEALEITHAGGQQRAFVMKHFWAAHQRFFKNLITAFKVPTAIKAIENDIKEGNSVVISLITTGEARTKMLISQKMAEGLSLEQLDFTPREVLAELVDKSFPIQLYQEETDENGVTRKVPVYNEDGSPVISQEALRMKQDLLDQLSDMNVPENPIDQIINYFGEDKVAELTGRKKRIIRNKETGKTEYVQRNPEGIALADVNTWEMDNFMSGKKRIAIISDAASTGISLHASNQVKNKQRRIFYALELGWSADKELQRMGRVHRSDQSRPPFIKIISTDIGGEKRFSSSLAKKLSSLGALSRGQRDVAGGDIFTKYNFEIEEGKRALSLLYRIIINPGSDIEQWGIKREEALKAIKDMGIDKGEGGMPVIDDKDSLNINRFLNRILCLDYDLQNKMFDMFIDLFQTVIISAKEEGIYDDGITDIKGDNIRLKEKPILVYEDKFTNAKTYHYTILADIKQKYFSFAEAEKIKNVEFWRNKQSGYVYAAVPIKITNARSGTVENGFIIKNYRGDTVKQSKEDFEYHHDKIDKLDAQIWWDNKIAESPKIKTEENHIIGGVILPVWNRIEAGMSGEKREGVKLKAARTITSDGRRIVGILIPGKSLGSVLRALNIQREISDPVAIYNAVMEQDEIIHLLGGLRLVRTNLNGNPIIELDGVEYEQYDRFRKMGLINERINYKQRFFIPADDVAGPELIKRLLESHPVLKRAEEQKPKASYSPTVPTPQSAKPSRPPKMTINRQARKSKAKALKIKQIAIESAKEAVSVIREMIRIRRTVIDLGAYDTNRFVDWINRNTTKIQRELIPFLIEKTEVPDLLFRPDLKAAWQEEQRTHYLEPIVNKIKAHFEKTWQYIVDHSDEMSAEQIEDYVTHIWDLSGINKKKKIRFAANYFITNNRFLKKRFIPTLFEGIQDAGLTPLTLDIGEIITIHDRVMYRVIANKEFADQVGKLTNKDGIPLVVRMDKAPSDWVYFDHPAIRKAIIIPGPVTRGEQISDELAWILYEMGVEIGKRINPVVWGKPTRKKGEYRPGGPGRPAQIRLQRFFENKDLAHEIGHHIDIVLNLGQNWLNQFKTELYNLNEPRIKALRKIGKGKYASTAEEQIAEFFGFLFTDPALVQKIAPNAMADALNRLKADAVLTKLVNLDFEKKAKMLIDEQLNTQLKLGVKVHPDIAKPLGVILDQKIDDRVGIVRAWEMLNGILKKTWLSISLFHHVALTETAIGMMKLSTVLKMINPVSFIWKGFIKGDNLAFKKQDVAKDFITHGGQLGASSDIPVAKIQEMLNNLSRKTKGIPVVYQMSRLMASFNERWDKALWNYLHDSFKLLSYEYLVSKEKNPTTNQKRELAQLVNDTFGGQNWDLLMLNPRTVQILHWTLLSPDWTLSTIRQALAPTGIGKMYKESVSIRRKVGALFWLKAGLYFMAGINLLNAVMRKRDREKYPEKYENREMSFWDYTMWGNTYGHETHLFVGRNEDGTERYIRWGKQFRELPELFFDNGEFNPITASLKKMGSKLTPAIQITSQMFTGVSPSGFVNRDIYGKKGTDRFIGIMKMLLQTPFPFSTRAVWQDNKEWHFTDLAMPSSKGMTKYKAIDYMKMAIEKKDERLLKEVYQGALLNNIDAYSAFNTALTSVKAENTKDLRATMESIEDAEKKLHSTFNPNERKKIKKYIEYLKRQQLNLEKGGHLLEIALKKYKLYEIGEEMGQLIDKQMRGELTSKEKERLEYLRKIKKIGEKNGR